MHRFWIVAPLFVVASGCHSVRTEPTSSYRIWVESQRGRPLSAPAPLRGAPVARGPKAVQETLQAEIEDADSPASASPFHRARWNTIHNADGSITRLYYFRVGQPGAPKTIELLKQFVPGFSGLQQGQDYWIQEKHASDPRKKNVQNWRSDGDLGLPYGTGDVADLLVLTAPRDLLERVDAFLEGVQRQTPQIEIEVTIVELAVDDELRTGFNVSFTRGTEDEPEQNLIQSVVVNLAQDLVRGTVGSFSAIQDQTVVNGLVEFLQTNTDSEVLSAPKLAVLNGHRAVIDAGSETPVFVPRFGGAGINEITTQFKNTGTKVVIVPFLISRDMVQLEISVEASQVTGFVTAGVGSNSAVENPLISRRNAYTVVNVPSSKTILIGGLSTSDEVESHEKIPILGDIPLLGSLFKKQSSTRRRSQVMFMVKPTVVRHKDRSGVLFDPGVKPQ